MSPGGGVSPGGGGGESPGGGVSPGGGGGGGGNRGDTAKKTNPEERLFLNCKTNLGNLEFVEVSL